MTDPITPPTLIVDQNRGFRFWHIAEIYTGVGSGSYVPNVDDLVLDYTQGFYRVAAVDYTTGLSTLGLWKLPKDPAELSDEDILLGAGPGYQSESYRIFLDQSVTPHTFSVDARLLVRGSTLSYMKIFKGTDVSAVSGQVISAFYDQSGNLVGENIPLELVLMPDANNIAIKTPQVGYTLQSLNDGEVVTAVFYDSVGQARSVAKLLVQNSAFIRTTDAAAKYIVDISVETAFLNPSDPTDIQYPINMPVSALNLMGVVTYSDGSKIRLPVDGTKFTMYGLNSFIATIQGQKVPLVLNYALSPGEYNYIGQPSPTQHISKPYTATTAAANGAYSVKLYATPVWVDALNGYRLEYRLYNLDREEVYDVTALAELQTNTRPFDPLQYGVLQNLTVAINLHAVDPQFVNHRHVQTFGITLLKPGDSQEGDNWTVAYTPGQTPPYGTGLKAMAQFVDVNDWHVDLSSGATTLTEWLNKTFYSTQPLFDPESELMAPEPNFFVVAQGNHRTEFPIAQWSSEFTITDTLTDGGVINLEFIKRTAETDLQVGFAGIVVHFPQAQ